MENPHVLFLSLLVFLPALGALLIATPLFGKGNEELTKRFAFGFTVIVFLMSIWMAIPGASPNQFSFDGDAVSEMQMVFNLPWIPSFDINYFMGVDGISFPLIVLTTFISMLSMAASWPIKKYVKGYCILFLLLETGMIGVFMALDFFLFYVFWEVMLLPMYFLIGIWGGPRREYAAIKFFLYTLLGSVFMLIAILILYYNSDLRALSPEQLQAAHVISAVDDAAAASAANALIAAESPQHTFNILALQTLGQSTDQFSKPGLFGWSLQIWAFLLLFVGFVIKVPSVPLHTWLPDAHVEAPTPISMILAGVLLKMGGYGIIRMCYPICPEGGYSLAWFVCIIGVVSMVYGAFAALAQKDFKRMVAYSSVSHMGYVVLGLGVWSLASSVDPDYWAMGATGAMFQMLAHGISSAGMFFMVGVIYDRVHHRDLDKFGGLFAKMPIYSGLSVGIFFAGLGLPGLCGFIGEVLVTLSVWKFSVVLAVISASVVVLTAAYILWALQRVYLGAEYKGPHPEALTPITQRELWIASPLLALAILFGVYPQALLMYMTPTITRQVDQLAGWALEHEAQQQALTQDQQQEDLQKQAALAEQREEEFAITN